MTEDSFSSLSHHIHKQFKKYLEKDIFEIAINKPGEVFLRENAAWVRYEDKEITNKSLIHFSQLVATKHKQNISEQTPLLSATLEDGLRIQIVQPPAVPQGQFVMCIRKPISKQMTWENYREQGFFDHVVLEAEELTTTEKKLLELKNNRQFEEFLKYAVLYKQNIIVSGATGSGKTTFTNLLINSIPREERIGTIEDAIELRLPHENCFRLLYSKGGQSIAKVTPDDLIEVCLRLTPSRIILAEIRGAETFSFIDAIYSGHDGCITSLHAKDPERAFQRMVLMFKKSEVGRGFNTQDILTLLHSQINVIVQINHDEKTDKRYIASIYYDPLKQKQSAQNQQVLSAIMEHKTPNFLVS